MKGELPSPNEIASIRSFYLLCTAPVRMLGRMSNDRDRVISITLSEQEWQAFVARQPQPVVWLLERIREEVKAQTQQSQSAA